MDAPLSAGRGKPDPSERKPRGGGGGPRGGARSGGGVAAGPPSMRARRCLSQTRRSNTLPMRTRDCRAAKRAHLRRVPEPPGRGWREEAL